MSMAFEVRDGNGKATPLGRAFRDALWPGVFLAVLATLVLLGTLVLPDGPRSFAFCDALATIDKGPCEVNYVNLALVGLMLAAVMLPVGILLAALLIRASRGFMGESLPPLAPPRELAATIARVTGADGVDANGMVPLVRGKLSARARRARIDVIRSVMAMLGLSRAAINAREVIEADKAAAILDADTATSEAAVTDIVWVEPRDVPAPAEAAIPPADAAPEAVIARVAEAAGEGERDFLPPRVVDVEPPRPAAPAAGFLSPVVATVDGGLIDLNRRISGLAGRAANVVVLADVRALRETQDTDTAAESAAPPATVADAAVPEPILAANEPAPAAIPAGATVAAPAIDAALAAEIAEFVAAETPVSAVAPAGEMTFAATDEVEVQAFRDLIAAIDDPLAHLPALAAATDTPPADAAAIGDAASGEVTAAAPATAEACATATGTPGIADPEAVRAPALAAIVPLEEAAAGYLQRQPVRQPETVAS